MSPALVPALVSAPVSSPEHASTHTSDNEMARLRMAFDSVVVDLRALDRDRAAALDVDLAALDRDVAALLEHDLRAATLERELVGGLDDDLGLARDRDVL